MSGIFGLIRQDDKDFSCYNIVNETSFWILLPNILLNYWIDYNTIIYNILNIKIYNYSDACIK